MTKIASILIVDDDADIGTMLKMMMEYKGYSVLLLNKADKALETLLSHPFDLVILDMLIGGINGTDVCRSIKNNCNTAHLSILMISALPDAGKTCIEAGASDFISKPFEMEEIVSKVSKLINKVGHL